MLAPVGMSIAQMREAAGLGAYLEFVYNGLIGPNQEFQIGDYVKAIREVGAKSCILVERSWAGRESRSSGWICGIPEGVAARPEFRAVDIRAHVPDEPCHGPRPG